MSDTPKPVTEAGMGEAERCHAPEEPGPLVTISRADYLRLIDASECDDMIIRCEICGAWLARDDAAAATTEDFEGCWKMATGRERDSTLCRSYRVSELANPSPAEDGP